MHALHNTTFPSEVNVSSTAIQDRSFAVRLDVHRIVKTSRLHVGLSRRGVEKTACRNNVGKMLIV